MRTFGGFRRKNEIVYGEVRSEEVHLLAKPFWLGLDFTGEIVPLRDLRIDVPVAPSKLMAVGLNYADHIAEMKRTPLGTPLIWFKAPTSLLPHEGTIEIAFPEHKTHFEVELAIVIGKRTKNVTQDQALDQALDHVFGFTIGEDISDRDLQTAEKQFARAKSFDTYSPVGPFVYTEVDVSDLPITLRQNGEVKQEARTSQMIYPVAEIVSFASQSLTLLPGDLIMTGTPSGVGPIQEGDELEARIGEWPPLRNRVVNVGRGEK
jgi:2-keto-4-pentenoate hydratase/2-oxohepta-3-ene-1,7-dioic acid hydratase in catechol pathway